MITAWWGQFFPNLIKWFIFISYTFFALFVFNTNFFYMIILSSQKASGYAFWKRYFPNNVNILQFGYSSCIIHYTMFYGVCFNKYNAWFDPISISTMNIVFFFESLLKTYIYAQKSIPKWFLYSTAFYRFMQKFPLNCKYSLLLRSSSTTWFLIRSQILNIILSTKHRVSTWLWLRWRERHSPEILMTRLFSKLLFPLWWKSRGGPQLEVFTQVNKASL